jgi:CheY-like chemotaxis protein
MNEKPAVTILLVEDDAGHAKLIEKNLRWAHMTDDLVLLKDGQAAVDYLFKTNEYAGAQHPLPHVILLDLNLPELDGYRVLERVKTDERTTHIPVMILSTSDDPHDIERCTARGCQSYFTKPVDYTQLFEAIQMACGGHA